MSIREDRRCVQCSFKCILPLSSQQMRMNLSISCVKVPGAPIRFSNSQISMDKEKVHISFPSVCARIAHRPQHGRKLHRPHRLASQRLDTDFTYDYFLSCHLAGSKLRPRTLELHARQTSFNGRDHSILAR